MTKNNLKIVRKNRTQREIANAVGVSQRAYSNYERGSREADYETLIKLAEFYNVSVDYLLGRTLNNEKYNVIGSNIVITINEDGQQHTFEINENDFSMVNAFLEKMKK